MAQFSSENQPTKRRRKPPVTAKTIFLDSVSLEVLKKVAAQALNGCIKSQRIIIEASIPRLKPESAPLSINVPKNISSQEKAELILNKALVGAIPLSQANDAINALTNIASLTDLSVLIEKVEQLQQDVIQFKQSKSY